ncbi:MAG: hypothetical protein ACI9ES_001867 [Oceanospirillaceae bacterium]|jgi:hypothetical protein
MLIYTSNARQAEHTDSAISSIFALSYYRSLRYAEVSGEFKGIIKNTNQRFHANN